MNNSWEKWYEETSIPRYNYRDAMHDTVIAYLNDNKTNVLGDSEDVGFDDILERMQSDDVTGNMSGSFWCNAFKAAQALAGNDDLAGKAYAEFCMTPDFNPEKTDVIIREYLLCSVLADVVDSEEDYTGKAFSSWIIK